MLATPDLGKNGFKFNTKGTIKTVTFLNMQLFSEIIKLNKKNIAKSIKG